MTTQDTLTRALDRAEVMAGDSTAAEQQKKAEHRRRVEEFLEAARKRWKRSAEAEAANRKNALEDWRFTAGDQWPSKVEAERKQDGRPCLTINQVKKFAKQIANEMRLNRLALRTAPIDDEADVETAKVFQGLIRNIEKNSPAAVAYNTAGEQAAIGGFGYLRILTEYADQDSFDQEIRVRPVWNPFTVYGDAADMDPVGADWTYAFIVEDVDVEEYKRRWPNSELASLSDFSSIGDRAPTDWLSNETIRIAEYFYIEEERKGTLYKLRAYTPNGDTEEVTADEQKKQEIEETSKALGLAPPEVLETREIMGRQVKWAKINAVEILEGNEELDGGRKLPGRYGWIPIVRVPGDSLVVDGKLILSGVIRDSKDSQRMYNYMASYEAEAISLAPKSPFVAAVGQIEGRETEWQEANREPKAVLQYKLVDVGGHPLPPPARSAVEPPIQAISHARSMSAEDIKATMGLYDASLGARSNETSGLAIRERKTQGSLTTAHFSDNQARAIQFLGWQLLDVIPEVYDRPGRVARIIGEDDQERTVVLNQAFEQTDAGGQKISRIYDLNAGKYDVEVYMGPSFASKRQEAVQSMLELTHNYPQIMPIAGDLMVRNMDLPGKDEIADRLKRSIPEHIRGPEPNQRAPLPPEVEQQMAQLSQQVEQLAQALDQATETINQKRVETEARERLEMEKIKSQERIEALKTRADLLRTEAQIASKEGIAELKAEIEVQLKKLDLLFNNASKLPGGEQRNAQNLAS